LNNNAKIQHFFPISKYIPPFFAPISSLFHPIVTDIVTRLTILLSVHYHRLVTIWRYFNGKSLSTRAWMSS